MCCHSDECLPKEDLSLMLLDHIILFISSPLQNIDLLLFTVMWWSSYVAVLVHTVHNVILCAFPKNFWSSIQGYTLDFLIRCTVCYTWIINTNIQTHTHKHTRGSQIPIMLFLFPPLSLSSLWGDLQPSPSLFLKPRSPNPAGSLYWSQHTVPAYSLPDAHCPLPQPHTNTTTLYTLYFFLPPFESY